MLKATIVVAFLMLAGFEAMGAPFDELFVRYEAQGSIYELAFAQLGQSRATRPEVRAYAATLVNDHEAYNGALRDLAESKGIAVPSGMATNDKKRLDRLAGMRGGAFDSAFVREAVRINGEDIDPTATTGNDNTAAIRGPYWGEQAHVERRGIRVWTRSHAIEYLQLRCLRCSWVHRGHCNDRR